MSFARLRKKCLHPPLTVLMFLADAYLTISCGGQSAGLPAVPSSTAAVATANATPTATLKAASSVTPPPGTTAPQMPTPAAPTSPATDEDALGELLERAMQELEGDFEGDDALDDLDDILR